ncbi:hypothetical protein GWI33_011520, partial [Rhynchophorus ferrugineus]
MSYLLNYKASKNPKRRKTRTAGILKSGRWEAIRPEPLRFIKLLPGLPSVRKSAAGHRYSRRRDGKAADVTEKFTRAPPGSHSLSKLIHYGRLENGSAPRWLAGGGAWTLAINRGAVIEISDPTLIKARSKSSAKQNFSTCGLVKLPNKPLKLIWPIAEGGSWGRPPRNAVTVALPVRKFGNETLCGR